jgi:hypothetical protein
MIISSVIAWYNIQIDGRHSVREVHTDDQGDVFTFDYMADVGVDVNAVMAARIPQVQAESDALQLANAQVGA